MIIRRSRLYLFFCLCFIVGIGVGFGLDELMRSLWFWLYVAVMVNIVYLVLAWKNKRARIISCGLIFLLAGMVRLGVVIERGGGIGDYNGGRAEFWGQVVMEPERRENDERLTVGRVHLKGVEDEVGGRILIYIQKYSGYTYGDWLRVRCDLRAPAPFEGFDYPKFLASKKVFSICYDPTIELENHNLDWWQKAYEKILGFKDRSKVLIDKSLIFPQSEVLSAFLLGIRSAIPQEIKDNFSKAGTSHILAISGLHITIVCGLLVNLMLALGLNRKKSFWLASGVMVVFLLVIGFKVSSLRAGLMGLLIMLALREGRLSVSVNSLLIVASILLLINPLLLFWDVGFQLSFMAVLGIIYLGPVLNIWLAKIRIPETLEIRSSLVMTLSAQIFVLPLIIYYFGRLSIISPLANALVLPTLPWLIMGGLLMILVGLVWSALAQVVGWLVGFGISYVLVITRWLIQVPVAYVDFRINWIIILLVYSIIFIGVVYFRRIVNNKEGCLV